MKSVLLIQSNEGERTAIAQFLRQRGWQVWEVDDEQNAMALTRQHQPVLVLWDLTGRPTNDLEWGADLRANRDLPPLRIIALGDPHPGISRTRVLEAGADEFLVKPVSPEELLRFMENLAPLPRPQEQAAVAVVPGTTLRFWGVRGSIPAPGPGTLEFGGNTSCLEVRAGGEIIVLDSGSGIRLLGRELASEFKVQPLQVTILISHTHWDHIQGFPFFLPAYDRKNHIRILGYEGAREGLTRVFSLQMEGPYFPIDFKELPSNIIIEELKDLEFHLGQVKVEAMPTNHPGVCMGYRLTTPDGTIVYLPDNEPCYLVHPQARQQLGDLPADVSSTKAHEQRTLEFMRGADALIIDAQYDAREYKSHMGWGHGCVDDVVNMAIAADVKRLYLFHHDPDHNDAKIAAMVDGARQIAKAHGSPILIEGAREGESCKLFQA